jgi:tetratricopeptide (TPR) repeat protein
LAQLFLNADRFKDAEEVFSRALAASDNDPDVREKLEDVEVRNLRHRYTKADKQAKESGADEAKLEVKRLRKELNQKLLVVYKNRAERYPANLAFKFDLALQYKTIGEFGEAIKEFQLARNDPRRKGLCLLYLGECFQKIKQFRLAMEHYESAIQEIPDRDADNKKLAFYRAGKLAFDMSDAPRAQKHLNVLASMDFAYRDVSVLLDKLANTGNDSGSDTSAT